MISEAYREQNRLLHVANQEYGSHGNRWAPMVQEICMTLITQDVLDYGCGKGTLAHSLPFGIQQYDPVIERFAKPPKPADVVVCTDVLEHVEPEHLDAVLDDLQRLTRKICLITIATRPAVKTLPDGRNTHLIVEPLAWWLPKILARFTLRQLQNMPIIRETQVLYTEGEVMMMVERAA